VFVKCRKCRESNRKSVARWVKENHDYRCSRNREIASNRSLYGGGG
jgi:uncharacterized protein YggL (DUF469 family)